MVRRREFEFLLGRGEAADLGLNPEELELKGCSETGRLAEGGAVP